MARTEREEPQVASGDGHAAGTETGQRGTGRRNEVAMGVAIVATVLVLFFGVRFLEDRPLFGGTYELVSEFENTDGLLPGNPVKIRGVQVGEISAIRLAPTGSRVGVLMEIRDDVRVPEGSVARIQGIAALDNVSVAIEPGPEDAPPLPDGAALPGTANADMLARVDSTLAGAHATVEGTQALVADTDRDLQLVLDNMRAATGDAALLMEDSRARLQRTLADLETAAAALNQFSANMDRFSARMDRLAAEGGDSLARAIGELRAVTRRLDGTAGALERGSADLEAVLAHVRAGGGTLGRLAYDESLYTRLDSVALRLDAILADFQENPGRYLERLELIDVF